MPRLALWGSLVYTGEKIHDPGRANHRLSCLKVLEETLLGAPTKLPLILIPQFLLHAA